MFLPACDVPFVLCSRQAPHYCTVWTWHHLIPGGWLDFSPPDLMSGRGQWEQSMREVLGGGSLAIWSWASLPSIFFCWGAFGSAQSLFLTLRSLLADSEDHVGCQGLNPGILSARQMPSMFYFRSSPFSVFQITSWPKILHSSRLLQGLDRTLNSCSFAKPQYF